MATRLIPGLGLYEEPSSSGEYLVPGVGIVSVTAEAGGTIHETFHTLNLSPSIASTTAGGIVHETFHTLNLSSSIASTTFGVFYSNLTMDGALTITSSASNELNAAIPLNSVLSASQSVEAILLEDISVTFSSFIGQSALLDYVGTISLNVSSFISETATTTSDVETVITIPLFCALTSSASFITEQAYLQDIGAAIEASSIKTTDGAIVLANTNNLQPSSTANMVAVYNQDIVNSIIQSAIKVVNGEAHIGIGINLSDEYNVLATLYDNVSLNTLESITSTVGNVITAIYTDDIINSVTLASDITIEGLLSLNSSFGVANTVLSIIEETIGLDTSLNDLYSTTEVSFVDFVDNIVASDEYLVGQAIFTTTNLDATVTIIQNGFTTDFVVVTPNKRVLISLENDRVIASLSTDRNVLIVK